MKSKESSLTLYFTNNEYQNDTRPATEAEHTISEGSRPSIPTQDQFLYHLIVVKTCFPFLFYYILLSKDKMCTLGTQSFKHSVVCIPSLGRHTSPFGGPNNKPRYNSNKVYPGELMRLLGFPQSMT